MALKDVLKKLKMEESSELGSLFKKLDDIYQKIEDTDKEIIKIHKEENKLKKIKEQLIEDAELMETMMMYKFNTGTRQESMRK